MDTVFDIMASWDAEAECWIAVCDALPLATEAPTLQTLHERVSAIVPEIAALNGHDSGTFRLVTEPAPLIAAE